MVTSFTSLGFGHHFGAVHRRLELEGLCLSEISGVPEADVPAHTHEVAHFCLVLGGSYLSFLEGGLKTRPPQSVIYYPPGSTHPDRIHPRGGRCFTVGLAPSLFGKLSQLGGIDAAVLMEDGDSVWLASKLYREFISADGSCASLLNGLAAALSGHVARCANRGPGDPPTWLRHVAEMIRQHCRRAPELQELAAEVGVHPVHLSRAFRRHFGVRPSDYMRRCRIEHAMEILQDPAVSLGQAAVLCGYADQSSFTRSFKRVSGLTPAVFRRRTADRAQVQSGQEVQH